MNVISYLYWVICLFGLKELLQFCKLKFLPIEYEQRLYSEG